MAVTVPEPGPAGTGQAVAELLCGAGREPRVLPDRQLPWHDGAVPTLRERVRLFDPLVRALSEDAPRWARPVLRWVGMGLGLATLPLGPLLRPLFRYLFSCLQRPEEPLERLDAEFRRLWSAESPEQAVALLWSVARRMDGSRDVTLEPFGTLDAVMHKERIANLLYEAEILLGDRRKALAAAEWYLGAHDGPSAIERLGAAMVHEEWALRKVDCLVALGEGRSALVYLADRARLVDPGARIAVRLAELRGELGSLDLN